MDVFVMRTVCDFIFLGNITVDRSNHSNVFRFNFTEIIGCDFNYSAPATSHQLLQSNSTSYQDLLPNSIGMNLSLLRKLLQHDDLYSPQGKKFKKMDKEYVLLLTIKQNKHVMSRRLPMIEKNWWDNLCRGSLTATRNLILGLHPILILLALTVRCLLLTIF